MTESATAERIGDGVYRVTADGRSEIVYVAAASTGVWSFWNGRVFFAPGADNTSAGRRSRTTSRAPRDVIESVAAPMPATVIKVMTAPGASVRKGDTVIVLEAMKMELPIRAPGDAVVTAVHCREGELVQPEAVLVEFASAP